MVEEVTVKKGNFTSDVAKEVTVAISAELNSKLPELLSKMEKNMEKLGIINYGISSPTVEDVFLKYAVQDKNFCQPQIFSYWKNFRFKRIGSINSEEVNEFSPEKNKNLTEG